MNWEMMKFNLVGWLYCLASGNLRKYDVLRAQAKLEAGTVIVNNPMVKARNLWGMHYPTPGATGQTVETGEPLAVFPTWWASWKARLSWDQRKGVDETLKGREWTLREYMTTVVAKGYNPSNDYVDAWVQVWDTQMGWFTKMVNPDLDTNVGWKAVIINVIIILIIGAVLWWLGKKVWRWFNRKVDKKFR